MDSTNSSELLGVLDELVRIDGLGTRVTVPIEKQVASTVLMAASAASDNVAPTRVYLRLAHIQGTRDANKLMVYVDQQLVGTVALYGLRRASSKHRGHSGKGLTIELDITKLMVARHLDDALGSLDVKIMPERALPESSTLTVERISILGHQDG